MTPPKPLMDRVKDARDKHVADETADIRDPNAKALWMGPLNIAFMAGTQFLLTELSRASEGQEPWIWLAKDPHGNFVRTVKESDLLQAKAAHVLEVQSLETALATMGVDYGAKIAELEKELRALHEENLKLRAPAAVEADRAAVLSDALMLRGELLTAERAKVAKLEEVVGKLRKAINYLMEVEPNEDDHGGHYDDCALSRSQHDGADPKCDCGISERWQAARTALAETAQSAGKRE